MWCNVDAVFSSYAYNGVVLIIRRAHEMIAEDSQDSIVLVAFLVGAVVGVSLVVCAMLLHASVLFS